MAGYPQNTATIIISILQMRRQDKRSRNFAQKHNKQRSLNSNTGSVAPEPQLPLITTMLSVSWSKEIEEIKIIAELKTRGSHEATITLKTMLGCGGCTGENRRI